MRESHRQVSAAPRFSSKEELVTTIYTSMYIQLYAYMHYIYIYIYMCVYIYIYIYIYICIYIYTHTHIYIHTYTHYRESHRQLSSTLMFPRIEELPTKLCKPFKYANVATSWLLQ
jgi:hypothetical protein